MRRAPSHMGQSFLLLRPRNALSDFDLTSWSHRLLSGNRKPLVLKGMMRQALIGSSSGSDETLVGFTWM